MTTGHMRGAKLRPLVRGGAAMALLLVFPARRVLAFAPIPAKMMWCTRRQDFLLSSKLKPSGRRGLRLTAGAAHSEDGGASLVPSAECEAEMKVKNSRFIGSLGHTPTIESAREYINCIKSRFPDARHHCYAFCIGHGASVTQGMSDDGEPSGTAGRPILAVLSGSNLGDCTLVVTRYSGGTKLGTGGLVKAYTESAQACLLSAEVEEKVELIQLMVTGVEYHQYPKIKAQLDSRRVRIDDESYGGGVEVLISVPQDTVDDVESLIRELTSGQAAVERA